MKIVRRLCKGRDEYKKIQSIAINKEDSEPEKGFSVDFDELKESIRIQSGGFVFTEPSMINYPIVQTTDNENIYTKHFRKMIIHLERFFLNADNNANFNDRNSIIYGHRMKDGSMFRKLDEYKDKSFWEATRIFTFTRRTEERLYIIFTVRRQSRIQTMCI